MVRLKASFIIVWIVLAFLCPGALADEASKTSPEADSDSSIAKNLILIVILATVIVSEWVSAKIRHSII